jgi:threonine synthase
MGLPIDHFIASTNINDTIPRYIKDGIFEPHLTKRTISNAMDVSEPSNFIRIQKIFNNDLQKLRKNISGFSFDDKSTEEAMRSLFNSNNYLSDPHSALGYLGLKKYMAMNKIKDINGIFISTAHSIKFKDVVEKATNRNIKYPKAIKDIMGKEKMSSSIENYSELKEYLLQRN